MNNSGERAAALLKRLEASGILLIEWETDLQIRLGYPLVSNGSSFFLVPDSQLGKVQELATGVGLSPADEKTLRSAYLCEKSGLAARYLIDDSIPRTGPFEGPPRRRLVFLPMSWAGITHDEVVPISVDDTPPPPVRSVHTVPLWAACAALVRIAAREERGSPLRRNAIEGLSSIIAYSLFDMSYEGDYMEFPPNDEPLSDKEKLEIENAVAEMKKWVFREDEEWIKEILIQIVIGEKSYGDLPYRET